MTTTTNSSSSCLSSSSSSSYPLNKFKFPATYSPSTVQFGAKPPPFLTPNLRTSTFFSTDDYGNVNSIGRRGLIFFSATLPVVFPVQEYVKHFDVEAEETPDAEGKLPEESLDAPKLKLLFQRKGFSTQELVALAGAHTLGNKGFGNPVVFDNSYYKILLERPWISSASGMSNIIGLPSDRALVEDDECLRWITNYANDQNLFFKDFKDVYIKLVNSGARWKGS